MQFWATGHVIDLVQKRVNFKTATLVGLPFVVWHGSSLHGHWLPAVVWRRSSSAAFCRLEDLCRQADVYSNFRDRCL